LLFVDGLSTPPVRPVLGGPVIPGAGEPLTLGQGGHAMGARPLCAPSDKALFDPVAQDVPQPADLGPLVVLDRDRVVAVRRS